MSNRWTESMVNKLLAEGKIQGYQVIAGKTSGKPGGGKRKYGNKKTEADGRIFDSKKEAARYQQLRFWERLGLIRDLRCQVTYDLTVDGQLVCRYVADFVYTWVETGEQVVEDVKSAATRCIPAYRLKLKLMKAVFNIEIKEI